MTISSTSEGNRILGINGLGRIGKLTLWYQASSRRYQELVVNVGRDVGQRLEDVAHYIESDSTYGPMHRFLHGFKASPSIKIHNAEKRQLIVDGTKVTILSEERKPERINWRAHQVQLVVDTTGRFLDPTAEAKDTGGSLRGHLEAGARVVIASAAYKMKDKSRKRPSDSPMLIFGINHHDFQPSEHCIVAAASCTTTALAHMINPLLQHAWTQKMLTASMSTIHASTNSQSVLDKVPGAGAKDLRKSRSIFNNIILTSTGAARALEEVLPQISKIGFMADSVRVPTTTASLIALNCTFQTRLNSYGESEINREFINKLYHNVSTQPYSGLAYSESQNVSTDMIGSPFAVTIEGVETHTRTGFITLRLDELDALQSIDLPIKDVEIPVTHLKLFGWYDNEMGSYTKRMCELVDYIAEQIL